MNSQPKNENSSADGRSDYFAVHRRLRAERGDAGAFACVQGCGRAAVDWAYLGDRPDGVPVPFSTDLWDDYAPMCKRCHMRFDRITERARQTLLERLAAEPELAESYRQRGLKVQEWHRNALVNDPEYAERRRQSASRTALANNSVLRRCSCGKITNKAAMVMHQRHSGHTGWTELTDEERELLS